MGGLWTGSTVYPVHSTVFFLFFYVLNKICVEEVRETYVSLFCFSDMVVRSGVLCMIPTSLPPFVVYLP